MIAYLKTLKSKSQEHLDETGMNWFEHWCHVWFMMKCCFMAFITGIPHAFVPGLFSGTGRKWMFDIPIKEQLHTRPTLLKDIQDEYESTTAPATADKD